jgi:hypothetical protein
LFREDEVAKLKKPTCVLTISFLILAALLSCVVNDPMWLEYYRVTVDANNLSEPRAANTKRDNLTTKIAALTALIVNFGAVQRSNGVEISVDAGDSYWLLLSKSNKQVAKYFLPAREMEGGGLDVKTVMFTEPEANGGYDAVVIIPADGDGNYGVGHVIPVDLRLVTYSKITADFSDLSAVREINTPWDAEGNVLIPDGSYLYIELGGIHSESTIELSLDNNDTYNLILFSKGKEHATRFIPANPTSRGLNINTVSFKPSVIADGYDAVGILPTGGDGKYSVGHITLK